MHSGHSWEDAPCSCSPVALLLSCIAREARVWTKWSSGPTVREDVDQDVIETILITKGIQRGADTHGFVLRRAGGWSQRLRDSTGLSLGWHPPPGLCSVNKKQQIPAQAESFGTFSTTAVCTCISKKQDKEICKYLKLLLLITSLFLLYKCYMTALGIGLLSFRHKLVQLLLL